MPELSPGQSPLLPLSNPTLAKEPCGEREFRVVEVGSLGGSGATAFYRPGNLDTCDLFTAL